MDSFVSVGKQILKDYCSPYASELESRSNELLLCNNKLKSIEDEINSTNIKIKEMNSKISHKLLVAVNRENKYYQKVSKIASIMRQFHNFIKSFFAPFL